MNFYLEFTKTLLFNMENNYSQEDNYDTLRFGDIEPTPVTMQGRIRKILVKEFDRRGYSVRQRDIFSIKMSNSI